MPVEVQIGDRVQVKRDTDSVFAGRRGTIKLDARAGYLVKLHGVEGTLYFAAAELEPVKRNEPR